MSTSKIPMRGISKLLTNLDPGVRARLESAFVEAENLNTFHNDAAINSQPKRVLSSLVDAPVITVDTSTLGYDVHWPKIPDRLVSFYEVQVSLQSNFAQVQSYKTVENFFAAEGVTSDTFIRVRAIRWDGQCSNWSDPASVSGAVLSSPVVYTSDISDIPQFYIDYPALVSPGPIQHVNVVPQKKNGGIMVFGSFGVEFYVDATGQRGLFSNTDPDAPFFDSLSVTINGAHVNTPDPIRANGNDDIAGHRNCVGYSVGFGPAFLSHSGFYASTYDNFTSSVEQGTTHGANGSHDGWHNLAGATGIVETVIQNISTDGSYYSLTLGAGLSTTLKTLTSKKHYFHISGGRTITGIEATLWCSGDQVGGAGVASMTIDRARLVDNGTVLAPDLSTGNVLSPSGGAPTAIVFGGPGNLWGQAPGFWTPGKINNKNFGFFSRIAVSSSAGGSTDTFMAVYAIELKVFSTNVAEEAEVDVVYIPATDDLTTYPDRRAVLKNCTLNIIEFGDDIT